MNDLLNAPYRKKIFQNTFLRATIVKIFSKEALSSNQFHPYDQLKAWLLPI